MRAVPAVAVLAAGLVVAATATGITYAATGSSGSVHACANAKGTLRLLDSHGHCPNHYSKVTINERGPRGRTGATGPAGPGAIRLAVRSSTIGALKESKPIGGSLLTVTVLCNPADAAQVYINLNPPGATFTFEGTGSFEGSGTGTATWLDPVTDAVVTKQLGASAEQVAAEQAADPHSVEFTTNGGTLAADVLVTQGSHMFSVQLGEFRDATHCFAHALVTPAG